MPSLKIAASVLSSIVLSGGVAVVSSIRISPKFAERVIHNDDHRDFISESVQHYNSDRSPKPIFSSSIILPVPIDKDNNNNNNPNRRRTEDGKDAETMACDVSFMSCLNSHKCTNCFQGMTDEKIDWSIIAPNTPCDDVLNTLITKANVCVDLKKKDDKDKDDDVDRRVFCNAFDSCVIWNTNNNNNDGNDTNNNKDGSNDEEGGKDNGGEIAPKVDCDALTSCDFEGFKPNYIGDGICHEFIGGCYNHAICNYDGGDCCKDTCVDQTDDVNKDDDGDGDGNGDQYGFHLPCGTDGYMCRDPSSKECVTAECKEKKNGGNGNDDADGNNKNSDNDNDKPINPKAANCTADETPYRLYQYDSFGDGWDKTEMVISTNSMKDIVYDGRLEDGSEGMQIICLKNGPTCYNTKLFGGYWGNEVSWEIKPMKNGAPALASGGSPMDCNFPIATNECTLTCDGKPNIDPADDEKYQSFHRMVNCIEDKCVLQIASCKADLVCASCLDVELAPAYCLASNYYNALVFCTECNCIEGIDLEEKKQFCEEKSRDPHENEGSGGNIDDDDEGDEIGPPECSFTNFMDGTDALLQYKKCSGIGTTYALVTEFDNDNFGMLDAFESCAHEYKKHKYGGKSALDCMRILENAILHPLVDPDRKDVPAEAIQALAADLMNNGEAFCDCTVKASQATPPCYDFIRFKTLLYESLDGCKALDEIDCPAWGEFYVPCNSNLKDKFGNVDFRNKEQCDYVRDRCGNVGPFPSFRRLDCEEEGVSTEAWDFYLKYENNCLKDAPGPGPTPTPPSPTPPSKTTPSPTKSKSSPNTPPYSPSDDDNTSPASPSSSSSSSGKKKYVPPEERGKKGSFKKFFNFIFYCLIAGGVYYIYKTRFSGGQFNYASFRRARNYYADDSANSGMYDSLNLQTSMGEAPSFMPPTLPPPPSAYEPQNQYSPYPPPGGNNGMGMGGMG